MDSSNNSNEQSSTADNSPMKPMRSDGLAYAKKTARSFINMEAGLPDLRKFMMYCEEENVNGMLSLLSSVDPIDIDTELDLQSIKEHSLKFSGRSRSISGDS